MVQLSADQVSSNVDLGITSYIFSNGLIRQCCALLPSEELGN